MQLRDVTCFRKAAVVLTVWLLCLAPLLSAQTHSEDDRNASDSDIDSELNHLALKGHLHLRFLLLAEPFDEDSEIEQPEEPAKSQHTVHDLRNLHTEPGAIEDAPATDTQLFDIVSPPTHLPWAGFSHELKRSAVAVVARTAHAINLLKLLASAKPLAREIPVYNRQKHFGGWVNADSDVDCYNTRDEVLLRDARGEVSFLSNDRCRVKGGVWHDPYSDTEFKQARSLHVDHVVPLKHAFVTGAWKWNRDRRCHYANFLDNGFHLLAVAAGQNLSKADKSPANWMPAASTNRCRYLRDWLRIKLIWDLQLTEPEAEGIRTAFDAESCDAREMTMSKSELNEQILKSQQPVEKCLQSRADLL